MTAHTRHRLICPECKSSKVRVTCTQSRNVSADPLVLTKRRWCKCRDCKLHWRLNSKVTEVFQPAEHPLS